MSDRVLVPMSRSEAGWYDALGERTGHGPTHRPIRAALDTDREELVARSAKEIHRVIATANQQAPPDAGDYEEAARAVLALLENGGQA